MNTKTTFLRLFAIAAIAAFCFTACKKTSVTEAPKPQDNNVVTISGRTANPAQGARVTMTQQQLAELKVVKKMRLVSTGGFTFTVDNNQGSRTEEITLGGDCPPVSEKVLDYYQTQANECCCSFAVCLQGEDCFFYFYYFGPNNGCTGGGNEM